MKKVYFIVFVFCASLNVTAQQYEVPVSETHEKMQTGKYQPTWDVERGAPNEIIPEPWQTCNCIGGWHYNTSIYEKGRYKSAATVVKQLVDIVSKNGNLKKSITSVTL